MPVITLNEISVSLNNFCVTVCTPQQFMDMCWKLRIFGNNKLHTNYFNLRNVLHNSHTLIIYTIAVFIHL